jgi:hypothetical protein
MKITVKKEFKGLIDIRDYTVKKLIADNENAEVECEVLKGISIYTPQELENPERISKQEFESMYKNQNGEKQKYRLYSYKWKHTF